MTSDAAPTFRRLDQSTKDDWGVIASDLQLAQRAVPDRVLTMLDALKHDYGGFPVDRLEHSLQCATRAERDGRDDEYVVCALLHDIGDTLAPYNHPAVAAAILRPVVSRANLWMLEHHGVFQGYYYWQHLGLDPSRRERYRDSPYFEHTAEFCAKYDQVAFDRDYRSEPLEHFASRVRTILTSLLPPIA